MPQTPEIAVETTNPKGSGAAVILCEHASNHIPTRYAGLGLASKEQKSHIAWDPGARDVSLVLGEALDAPLIAGCISRLVYDCNRPPESPDAIVEKSEHISVPGNTDLSEIQRSERVQSVYEPFCAAVDVLLRERVLRGQITVLVTVHSFTPVFFDARRTVEIGILHDEDSRLADAMLSEKSRYPNRVIKRNEPYGPADGVTHSLKIHGIDRGLMNVMLEIRNDLISDRTGVHQLSDEILQMLKPAIAQVTSEYRQNA